MLFQAQGTESSEPAQPLPVFEDPEVRAFYESLPDIRALVPAVLLGAPEAAEQQAVADKEDSGSAAGAAEGGQGAAGSSSAADAGKGKGEKAGRGSDRASDRGDSKEAGGSGKDGKEKETEAAGDKEDGTAAAGEGRKEVQHVLHGQGSGGRAARPASRTPAHILLGTSSVLGTASTGPHQQCRTPPAPLHLTASSPPPPLLTRTADKEPSEMEVLLAQLPSCVSREACDEVAVNFCFMASKAARRRLARALCDVPRGATHLLPYWARIAASLASVFPDIPQGGWAQCRRWCGVMSACCSAVTVLFDCTTLVQQQRWLSPLLFPTGLAAASCAAATHPTCYAPHLCCSPYPPVTCPTLTCPTHPAPHPPPPAAVVAQQEEDMAALASRRDTTVAVTEARTRSARYLGELVKFRLVHYGSLFSGLKGLLDDFVGANIDSACELLETSGRFLIRLPETRSRMENMLEQMMRLKKVGGWVGVRACAGAICGAVLAGGGMQHAGAGGRTCCMSAKQACKCVSVAGTDLPGSQSQWPCNPGHKAQHCAPSPATLPPPAGAQP